MDIKTKIVCTIGPAVTARRKLQQLVESGMNVARLNCSHGNHRQYAQVIRYLKEIRKQKSIPLAIMLDLRGPEIRIGKLTGGSITLRKGQKIRLVSSKALGNRKQISLSPASVLYNLQPGMSILFDDGLISAEVTKVAKNAVDIVIKNPGKLLSNKGVNIPHYEHPNSISGKRDLKDILFGCAMDVDCIALSFVQSVEQIEEVRKILRKMEKESIFIISKIESAKGIANLDSIIQASDGIMIARGDLGVELPITTIPRLQQLIIYKCYQAAKPVITATQMLESMMVHPRPTRAEVSDIANAVLDGSSAVMLSGETAIGAYPIEAVQMMQSVILEAEKEKNRLNLPEGEGESSLLDVSSSLAFATAQIASSIRAKAIFAYTETGLTVRAMARFHLKCCIVAITTNIRTYHQLSLSWGVIPLLQESYNFKNSFQAASDYSIRAGIISIGDFVIVISRSPFDTQKQMGMVTVMNIGDVIVRGLATSGNRVSAIAKVITSKSAIDACCYEEIKEPYILVTSQCNTAILPLLEKAVGLIVQNYPEDIESETFAYKITKKKKIPLLLRAWNACSLIKDGELVTLDSKKGVVLRNKID